MLTFQLHIKRKKNPPPEDSDSDVAMVSDSHPAPVQTKPASKPASINRAKPKPAFSKAAIPKSSTIAEGSHKRGNLLEDSDSDNARSPLAAGSSKKPQRQTQADTEDHPTVSPVPKAKRKRAATHTSASPEDRKGKKRSEVIEDSRKPKRGKKVPIEDESAGEDTVPQKKAAIKAAGTDVKGKRKPSIRAGSKLPEVDSDSEKDVPAPKKKKMRKLNAFSSAQPQTFDWGFNEVSEVLHLESYHIA